MPQSPLNGPITRPKHAWTNSAPPVAKSMSSGVLDDAIRGAADTNQATESHSHILGDTTTIRLPRAHREPIPAEIVHQAQSAYLSGEPSRSVFDAMMLAIAQWTDSEYGWLFARADEGSGQGLPDLASAEFGLKVVILGYSPVKPALAVGADEALRSLAPFLAGVVHSSRALRFQGDESGSGLSTPILLKPIEPVRSLLAFPLIVAGRPIGALALANRPGGYDESWLEKLAPVVEACARLSGAALRDRRRDEELSRAREEARGTRASREAEREYLACLCHELRTPLTAILGCSTILSDTCREIILPAQAAEALAAIERNGCHVLDLMDGVLEFSEIETVGTRPRRIYCRVDRVLDDVLASLGPQARSKGLKLRSRRQAGKIAPIETDPLHVRQILFNLVANAIKFTTSGQVEVGLSWETRGTSEWPSPQLRVDVRDSGIGISVDELSRLFHPFERGLGSNRRTLGGGLGLVVSRKLAEGLGGRIEVASQPGKGAVFSLCLPLVWADDAAPQGAIPQGEAAPATTVASQRKTVLVVEDDAETRRVVDYFLRRAGYQPTIVVDGRAALRAAARTDFDVIVLDMRLPGLDGHETLRRLRAIPVRAPILAFTANATREQRRECLDMGCAGFVAKPVSRDDFLAAIRAGTESRRAPEPFDPPVEVISLEPSSVPRGADLSSLADPDFLELRARYVSRLPDRLQDLRASADQEDWTAVHVWAHRVCGCGGLYGFPELSGAARALCDRASTGATRESILAAVDEILRVGGETMDAFASPRLIPSERPRFQPPARPR